MRRSLSSLLTCVFIASVGLAPLAAAQPARPDTTDPYRWLEEMTGERAMAWVKAENAKTVKVLEQDPRFAGIYNSALGMAQAQDRIPQGTFIGGAIYNFWQDAAHVRGIWRRTTLASYRTKAPVWTTVLDLDQLAKTENANWVWHGADCARPAETRCLISLSDGGEDAVTIREFDLVTRTFPADGFMLAKSKQLVAWMGTDTLLVAREWDAGDMTASGYPYIVKRVARAQPLSAAVEIFRGTKQDVLVAPLTLTDAMGNRVSIISRGLDFFSSEQLLVRGTNVVKLSVPPKASIDALLGGQLIVRLSEPWTTGATTIRAGALASISLRQVMATPAALTPVAVVEPGPRESVQGAVATRTRLLVGMTDNVRGRVFAVARTASGRWQRTRLALPDNVNTSVLDADGRSEQAFIGVTGFLTPSSVWLANAATATATSLKTLPPRFDASRSVVEQFEATSSDGTRIPYFITHPRDMKLDGSNPTILRAYGGFELSSLPSYDANVGKLWVEQGGVHVVANIRGGGEFGPAWHEAGLKTKRQIIYDDFAAVAQDLIARKITGPRRLGILGGSNGGLLMGVEMNQHPELFNAVQIAVPLLDMLRYEQIAAGASWVGEYGSVSNPDERAFLERISPLHNLKAGVKYPTPFIWTTTKDDRVGPQHARKFAAKMADMGLPYLFYEVTEGGHGSGANAEQQARTTALGYTYFMRQLMGDTRPIVP
jgi:prolyl oligopeptidase